MEQSNVIKKIAEVLNVDISKIKCENVTTEGGMMGDLIRVYVESAGSTKSYILKQLIGESKLQTSKTLGLIREAEFYNSELSKAFHPYIAKCYYAYGNPETGEKQLLLEDLSPAIQAGLLFGPGNPNNWAKIDQLETISKNFLGEKSLILYIEHTFRALGKIHAKFWKKKELLSVNWLRGNKWWSQSGEESWVSTQQELLNKWNSVRGTINEPNGLQWDKEFLKIMDASMKKISFTDFRQFTQNTAWTLVTGDCHPANFMWIPNVPPKDSIRVVDFEMVAVGSGPQDLAQFMISHCEPNLRKNYEIDLLQSYYSELIDGGVKDYTWEDCLKDYVKGGSERWIWLCGWMAALYPQAISYFNSQVIAFCVDHHVTPENIGQPRC